MPNTAPQRLARRQKTPQTSAGKSPAAAIEKARLTMNRMLSGRSEATQVATMATASSIALEITRRRWVEEFGAIIL